MARDGVLKTAWWSHLSGSIGAPGIRCVIERYGKICQNSWNMLKPCWNMSKRVKTANQLCRNQICCWSALFASPDSFNCLFKSFMKEWPRHEKKKCGELPVAVDKVHVLHCQYLGWPTSESAKNRLHSPENSDQRCHHDSTTISTGDQNQEIYGVPVITTCFMSHFQPSGAPGSPAPTCKPMVTHDSAVEKMQGPKWSISVFLKAFAMCQALCGMMWNLWKRFKHQSPVSIQDDHLVCQMLWKSVACRTSHSKSAHQNGSP